MIRHEGVISGFRASISRWPSFNLAVVILTNLQTTPIEGVSANIATRVVPELKTAPVQR
jgi:hypothetical protein